MDLNPTQATLLGLLHDAPQTGGDMNAIAAKWLAPYWNMTRSQVYRDLPTLADAGYIKAIELGSRNSVKYKLTPSGKKAFQRWLKEDPSPELMRNEAVMRIALGGLHSDEQLQDLLNWMRNHHELKSDEISKLMAEAKDEGMDYDVAALRFALMYHQMMIGWLETVELPE